MTRVQSVLDKIEALKEPVFFFFLFIAAFIFRLPTLFNDFYDIDELAAIIQTREYLAGYIPGIDFTESKFTLYHTIFKLSYKINAVYGWVIVHVVTILFVFLTAYSVYCIGRLLKDRRTGIMASVMYAVLISSFNRHFMATNGEVIYNLPVTAGLLFFLLVITKRSLCNRIAYSILTLLCVTAAMMVKFHGAILLLFICFFLLFYMHYYKKTFKRFVLPYIITAVLLIGIAAFDFFITKKIVPGLISSALDLLFYATSARSKNPLYILGIFFLRQFTLGLWHFVLWIPAAVYIFRFIKNKFRKETLEESTVALFAVLTFFMVFAGGARLYYHYFMTSYPSLCVISAIALGSFDTPTVKKIRSCFITAVLVPGIFFIAWNFKDIYVKYYNQDIFYNEPKAVFWFRAVFVSSMNDYLLPDDLYRNTVEYIKTHTSPSDTIFVWGDGPHLYYFSDRPISIKHVWPKGKAIKIARLYKENNPDAISEAVEEQNGFILQMEKKKPALFIDTSPKGLISGFLKYGNFAKFPFEVPPLMKTYLNKHYKLETVVDDYKIYRRVK